MKEQMVSKVIGYARVSADDQVAYGQVDALRRSGVTEVVVEQASGIADRPRLDSLVASLVAGDALMVTEVSRLRAYPSRLKNALFSWVKPAYWDRLLVALPQKCSFWRTAFGSARLTCES
jgi:predicted site-specific integrase-resolvase